MKKMLKKMLMACSMLMACMMLAGAVHAASMPSKDELKKCFIQINKGSEGAFGWNFPSGTKFTKIKFSKKGFTTEKINEGGDTLFLVKTKKAAKTTLTFTATYKKKTRSYKVNITSFIYKNPLKTLKIGKKNYASNFKKHDWSYPVKKTTKGKLSVKMNKGFKLKDMYIQNNKTGKPVKFVKNNQKITIKKGQSLQIIYDIKAFGDWGWGFTAIIFE